MNTIDKTPATGTKERLLKFEGGSWFILLPEQLDSDRILAQKRVLNSIALFLMTLTTGAPPAGEPLRPDQMLPAGVVLADRSGEDWREGFWVCAACPGPTKLDVLVEAVFKAALEGVISLDEALAAFDEFGAMEEMH